MDENGSQKRILTIPNLLSAARIVMIPVVACAYLRWNDDALAACLLALTCLTDVLDGWIARRWNMGSDLGKILDVVADKLLQFSILLCAAAQYRQALVLAVILVVRECVSGYYCLRYIRAAHEVDGAQWFGKLTTAVLDLSLLLMCMFRNMPPLRIWSLVAVCAVLMLFSFYRYVQSYRSWLGAKKNGPMGPLADEQ